MKTQFFLFVMLVCFPVAVFKGQNLEWANGFGSAGKNCKGNSVVHDNAGNIIVTGSFTGTVDLDPGTNTKSISTSAGSQIFLAKYDANGNYLWGMNMGGTGVSHYSSGNCVTTDVNGNILITGSYYGNSVDFDPGPNVKTLSTKGGADIFIAKYDPDGNYLWAAGIGGNQNVDQGYAITCDTNGNSYATGIFWGSKVDFDAGMQNDLLTSSDTINQSTDIFIVKYDANGNYRWAFNIGCTATYNGGTSIACDNNKIYVTGYFNGTADFDPGTGTDSLKGHGVKGFSDECFVAAYDTAGNYKWAINIGGSGNTNVESYDISPDGYGGIYLTGYIQGNELTSDAGIDFDPSNGIDTLLNIGDLDIFLARYDTSGNYEWAFNIGAPGGTNYNCISNSVHSDENGNAVLTGYIRAAADFDPGTGTNTLTSSGYTDIFLAKYDTSGNNIFAFAVGKTGAACGGRAVSVDGGAIYVTGYFQGSSVDYFPGSNNTYLNAQGTQDVFIAKYNQLPTGAQNAAQHHKSGFTLFPNPTTGSFTIESLYEKATLTVTDLFGKVVYSATSINNGMQIETNLTAGVYFITVSTQDQAVIEKLIIK